VRWEYRRAWLARRDPLFPRSGGESLDSTDDGLFGWGRGAEKIRGAVDIFDSGPYGVVAVEQGLAFDEVAVGVGWSSDGVVSSPEDEAVEGRCWPGVVVSDGCSLAEDIFLRVKLFWRMQVSDGVLAG
jgi:hypothetical protein